METHYRDSTGRFVATLPIKNNVTDIGYSREIARRRFLYGESKRMKNPELQAAYSKQINDMIKAGYLVLATERPRPGELAYYLPHHSIKKDNRIVYDGSCKTDTGVSLNDVLMLGPKLQRDLHETIMRFRRHKIAVYADIRKMYNQVRLSRDQWKLQTILWRENKHEPLREYWLTVITFGISASGFIAVRSLIQAAREAKNKYPKAAKAIEEDFYMDDVSTGEETVQKAIN